MSYGLDRAMSPHGSPPHLSLVTPEDEPTKRLTRSEVATRLGCSVSTVRRYEGERLLPEVGEDGVRRFKAADVARLARELVEAREGSPRARERAVDQVVERSAGEVAALVFERLELRHSLAEIVIGLRLPPEDVRELYHAWLKGLQRGELDRKDCALPAARTAEDLAMSRRVDAATFAALLASLPTDAPTRISVAADCDEWLRDDAEYRYVKELGGFVGYGALDAAELWRRYGEGTFRVTACSLEPPGLRWEVFTALVAPPR